MAGTVWWKRAIRESTTGLEKRQHSKKKWGLFSPSIVWLSTVTILTIFTHRENRRGGGVLTPRWKERVNGEQWESDSKRKKNKKTKITSQVRSDNEH